MRALTLLDAGQQYSMATTLSPESVALPAALIDVSSSR